MESAEAAARTAPPHGGKKTLSPEEPVLAAAPMPLGLGDVSEPAQLDGGVLDDPRTSNGEDEDAVLGNEEEEVADELLSGEENEDLYDADDGDSEFEEDDDEPLEIGDDEEAGSNDLALAAEEFLGQPARFTSVQSTAGFMRLRFTADARGSQDAGGEILVDYRYTRFSSARTEGHGGVDVYSGRKLHRVRFLVPSHAADPASSLRLAGAALADMVYPRRFSAQLQALWSDLVAAAAPARVPPQSTHVVEVTVDVGILRPGDLTPERMACVRAALPDMARDADAWPFLRSAGMLLHLPAPVRCEDTDGARPAKRMRFAVAEECAICYEALERGLAAWPVCSHVFHGECLEQLLVRGDQRCPLCRSSLEIKAHG